MLQFSVHVYNPLARPLSRYFRFPVNCPSKDSSITMQDSSSVPLSFELVPVSDATKAVRRHRGNAQCELLFSVQLPALGYEAFKVTKLAEKDKRKRNSDPRFVKKRSANEDVEINNEFYKVQFDGTTGLLKSIENLQSLVVTQVRQQLLWYNSSLGNHASPQQSGAYIFRPNSSTPFTCSQDGHAQITKLEGSSLVQEVYQKFNDWAWQVFRLYKGRNDIEVEWTVGPIPLQDKWGKEIIARYDTDLLTSGYFYTDANGREVLQRKRNYRPSWTLNQSEPVAGNYYPVNTRIYIKDTKRQFTLLTDRSQGGASIKDGSLEVMVHRRLLGEDSGAVAEPLNETGQYGDGLISRGKHWLLLDTVTASAKQHRLLAEEIYMAPVIMFKNITRINNSLNAGSRLFAALPENVHLLTLSSHKSGGILIRLEHQFEKTDHAKLSSSVTISLKNLFKNFEPSSVEELLLGANVKKDDVTRLKWKAMQRRRPDASHGVQSFERPYVIDEHVMDGLNDAFDITLFPMQIRTFLLK